MINVQATASKIFSISIGRFIEIFKCFFEYIRDPQNEEEINTHICCEHYKNEFHRQIQEEARRAEKKISIP